MDDPVTMAWAIGGLVLIALEFVIPGLVVVFLGCGALLVAGFRYLGWIEGWMSSFTAWFISSLALVISLRSAFSSIVGGQTERTNTDEDIDAIGTEVEVVEPIGPDGAAGRIRFRETTWAARCKKGSAEAGTKARIVRRQGLEWVVEPVDEQASR